MWSPSSHDWGHHVAWKETPLSRTSKLHCENLLYLSTQPDGSPDYVTSVSMSEPAMHLPPVYVDGQYASILGSIKISRAQGERKDGDVIRIFRGLHELLGCSAAGHSGDASAVLFFDLGLSNPAGLLC